MNRVWGKVQQSVRRQYGCELNIWLTDRYGKQAKKNIITFMSNVLNTMDEDVSTQPERSMHTVHLLLN